MEPFTTLTSTAVVLPDADIDTDIIFPARFLLITSKTGLGRYAFHEKRYEGGVERPDFPLNQPAAKASKILVTGDNFGCGSSREQAVWALHDLGVRCVISTRFGEIFHANCFKCGVLPVILPADLVARLMGRAKQGEMLTVDLNHQTIAAVGADIIGFEVSDWRRQALLNGWDDVLIMLNTQVGAIEAFEDRQRAQSPWLYPSG